MTSTGGAGRRFRPRFWPSFWALPVFFVLIALGAWQLERLEEKQALIAELAFRSSGPAVELPRDLSDPESLRYLKVAVTGHYLHDREAILANRVHRKEVGRHILTPFRLENGRTIIVDRGWVPFALEAPETRKDSLLEGRQRLVGLLRQGGFGGPAFLEPANEPDKGLYNWVDLPGLAQGAGLVAPITTLYLALATIDHGGDYPKPQAPTANLANNHRLYAITWFSLAAILAVMFFFFSLRQSEESR